MLCPRCQNALNPGAAFCGTCGMQIAPGTNPPAPQPLQPAVPVAPLAPVPPSEPVTSQFAPAPNVPLAMTTPAPAQPAAEPLVATQQPEQPTQPVLAQGDHSGKAITSFVLGVLGVPACIVPILGIALGVLAIVFGTLSIRSARKIFAVMGMSLAVLVLLVSLFLWVRNTQELVKDHRSGSSVGASSNVGPLQAISTPCYTTKIPAAMHVTQTAGNCTFLGVNTASGEQTEVKVLQVPGLTSSSLSTSAKADAANVVGSIPGGSIGKERTATFAGSQAYQIEIKSTDGSAGTVDYVYDTTTQGNLVIVLHTQAHASGHNYDLSTIESNWSWL